LEGVKKPEAQLRSVGMPGRKTTFSKFTILFLITAGKKNCGKKDGPFQGPNM
jgi:hypothetical protein